MQLTSGSGDEGTFALGPQPKAISGNSHDTSVTGATENAANDDEAKGTTLIEERGPIDPNLDLVAHGEDLLRIEQDSAAADVNGRGIAVSAIQEIPGADIDREPLMLATFRRSGPWSGT